MIRFKSIYCMSLFLLMFVPVSAFAAPGNTIPGDYDKDGRSDIVVARQYLQGWYWFIKYATGEEVGPILFGLASDVYFDKLYAGDYDGDGDFEFGVVRKGLDGLLYWLSYLGNGQALERQWGLANDRVLTGTFFGTDTDRIAIRNVGGLLYWFIKEQGVPASIQWGLNGDVPFTGDIDGDGIDELIVARKSGGLITWFIRTLAGQALTPIQWGLTGDFMMPPADFNGDYKDDLIVTRKGSNGGLTSFIRYTDINFAHTIPFGLVGDTPFIGNFTQSMFAELGAYRHQAGQVSSHFIRFALQNFVAQVFFGLSGDFIVRPDGMGIFPEESVVLNPPANPNPGPGNGISSVCNSIEGFPKGLLWKQSSDDSGEPREGKPALLVKYNPTGATCLKVFATNGVKISELGYYGTNQYGRRYYSGWGCGDLHHASDMAQLAQAQTGSAQVYVERGPGLCHGPFDPRNRTGSL